MVLVIVTAKNRSYVTSAPNKYQARTLIKSVQLSWEEKDVVGYIYAHGSYEEVRRVSRDCESVR